MQTDSQSVVYDLIWLRAQDTAEGDRPNRGGDDKRDGTFGHSVTADINDQRGYRRGGKPTMAARMKRITMRVNNDGSSSAVAPLLGADVEEDGHMTL